ncbi:hypothetical protein DRO59_04345 [Candidatus Bathyarchaeota archaeon]|nr:MAG: hypothetical protein DRO59_04345 [Candidatus Bathyarchaeota archaeon]
MRSDYALYIVAIIFFLISITVFFYQEVEYRELWTVTTVVLGFLFLGLGYTLRPKITTTETPQPPTPAPPTTVTETPTVTERAEVTVETAPTVELTQVKGIGPKRAEQLKSLGINSIKDLAEASAKNLATKLEISPKITRRWIENAKKLVEK